RAVCVCRRSASASVSNTESKACAMRAPMPCGCAALRVRAVLRAGFRAAARLTALRGDVFFRAADLVLPFVLAFLLAFVLALALRCDAVADLRFFAMLPPCRPPPAAISA